VKISQSIAAWMIAAPAVLFMPAVHAAGHEDGENHEQHEQHEHDAMDGGQAGAEDHSMHMGHSTARDEKGRRLFDMKHEISGKTADELRQRIIGWENISDAEIALSMQQMGSNYEWYISGDDVTGEIGVLILLHGFRERGDTLFREEMEPYADIFPTALSFGMSMVMSDHIQLALDDLVAAGVQDIVVIPIVSTEHNTMIRQWQYIFGLRDEPSYATVRQVETETNVIFADPPNDDPLVAEILLDHALEISDNPENEVVIVAAHGPSSAEDNRIELEMLNSLAKIVEEDGGFVAAHAVTLQDDAPPEVRAANVERLRALVEGAAKDGRDVLVVTNLIGARTIQAKLRKDLKGLDYKFNAKGISQHDNFTTWIGEIVRAAAAGDYKSALN